MTLTRTAIKRKSKQKADEGIQLMQVYAQIARERPQVCAGCGQPAGGLIKLSHSHLVPRSKNEDLITEPRNIAYHCVDWMGHVGCHGKHESSAHRHELLDFRQNMTYIKEADPDYFKLLQLRTHVPEGYENSPFD